MSCLACDICQKFLAAHPQGFITDDCQTISLEMDGFIIKVDHTCGRRVAPSPWSRYPREFGVDDRCDV